VVSSRVTCGGACLPTEILECSKRRQSLHNKSTASMSTSRRDLRCNWGPLFRRISSTFSIVLSRRVLSKTKQFSSIRSTSLAQDECQS
jgi:hypothetical protein